MSSSNIFQPPSFRAHVINILVLSEGNISHQTVKGKPSTQKVLELVMAEILHWLIGAKLNFANYFCVFNSMEVESIVLFVWFGL